MPGDTSEDNVNIASVNGFMMETISALLAICAGNSQWIPRTKASDAEL